MAPEEAEINSFIERVDANALPETKALNFPVDVMLLQCRLCLKGLLQLAVRKKGIRSR